VAAAGGGAATRRSVATWYPGLRKPSWTPPSQVFGPVWTVLYAQMAYSANRVARSSEPGRRRALAHLHEFADYYTRLDRMKEEAKRSTAP